MVNIIIIFKQYENEDINICTSLDIHILTISMFSRFFM
jgi:hypothetical protein